MNSKSILRAGVVSLLALAFASAAYAADRTKTTQFKMERGALVLPAPIQFETGSDTLKAESDESLFVVLDFLESKSYISTLRIEGHTDNTGKPADNQDISERLALSVAKWLIAHGADCKRLLPVGFGSTKPTAPNDTPANKAANRRIDFLPAAIKGKAIGGAPLDGGGKPAGDPCK